MQYEMPPNHETKSTLPKLPVNEYFTHRLYADIGKAFWEVSDDPDRAELIDQFPIVVESLTPEELFDVAALMYNEFPHAQDEEGNRVILWGRDPDQLEYKFRYVSAKDDVQHKPIGYLDDVVKFIKKYYVPEKGAQLRQESFWLEEHFIFKIMEGFENFSKDEQTGTDVEKAIRVESNRRIKIPRSGQFGPMHRINQDAFIELGSQETSGSNN
jgi:hypothetical protein